MLSLKTFEARKRVTSSTGTKMYSRVLIAGGMGSEKKDPARSPIMGKKKRIEPTIARLEANLTLLKSRTIDAKSRMRPVKMVPIAM